MTTTSPADSQLRACGSGGDGCDVRRFVAEHQRGPAEVGEPGGGRDARRSRVVERVQVGRDAALVKDAPGSLRDQAPRETLAAGLRLGADRDLVPELAVALDADAGQVLPVVVEHDQRLPTERAQPTG